ncbi:MAG: L,D-transpeptidase family protein [Verrucomicrobia bacterium]|nr:L,D-transpeptidase family protein [Verrucomicrobiota bacterium]
MVRILSVSAAAGLLLSLSACTSSDPRWARGETQYLGGLSNSDYSRARTQPEAGAQRADSGDSVSFWDGDGVKGPPRIEIRLSEQRAYFYKGDTLVGVSAISSGREGYASPTGSFRIVDKRKDHRSSIYGEFVDAVTGEVVQKDVDSRRDKPPKGAKYMGSPMPNFMRFAGGVGLHAGYLPGVPASHGCIRMPHFMSENFFNNVEIGTPVIVTN